MNSSQKDQFLDEKDRLEVENDQLREEIQLLKHQLKDFEENFHFDSGEQFLQRLAHLVNSGIYNRMQVQDGMFGVVRVDYNKMVQKNGRQEPYMYFIGYSPSTILDLRKLMNIPSLIGLEDPDTDTIRKVIYQAMEHSTPSFESDFLEEPVPPEAFGAGFLSTTMAIRDDNNRVIGGFGIATHLDIYAEINNLFKKVHEAFVDLLSMQNELLKITYKDQIEKMKGTISNLLQLSQSVTDAVKEIEKISEHTRLLSFNASIESARAGNYGKGFSVVSGEIRKLSEKSKNSVSKIHNIIMKTLDQITHMNDIEDMLSDILTQKREIEDNQKPLVNSINELLDHVKVLTTQLQEQKII
jgi:hypothetical protein